MKHSDDDYLGSEPLGAPSRRLGDDALVKLLGGADACTEPPRALSQRLGGIEMGPLRGAHVRRGPLRRSSQGLDGIEMKHSGDEYFGSEPLGAPSRRLGGDKLVQLLDEPDACREPPQALSQRLGRIEMGPLRAFCVRRPLCKM